MLGRKGLEDQWVRSCGRAESVGSTACKIREVTIRRGRAQPGSAGAGDRGGRLVRAREDRLDQRYAGPSAHQLPVAYSGSWQRGCGDSQGWCDQSVGLDRTDPPTVRENGKKNPLYPPILGSGLKGLKDHRYRGAATLAGFLPGCLCLKRADARSCAFTPAQLPDPKCLSLGQRERFDANSPRKSAETGCLAGARDGGAGEPAIVSIFGTKPQARWRRWESGGSQNQYRGRRGLSNFAPSANCQREVVKP